MIYLGQLTTFTTEKTDKDKDKAEKTILQFLINITSFIIQENPTNYKNQNLIVYL